MLAACAAPPARPPVQPVQAATDARFALEGRVAVRFGDESLAGKIAWSHTPERDEIALASPLGNQLASIVRDAGGVVLTNSGQQQFRAADAESLTEQQLGWRLPLARLADWALARGAGSGTAVRDDQGRLARLKDSGWTIEFAYDGDTARLPRRLILNYTAAEKALEIRLAIDRWSD